jgi:ABC-2 type transport system permease protein
VKSRVRVLLEKEWADLRTRRGLLLMTFLLPTLFLVVLPFVIGVGMPALLGEKLSEDPDLAGTIQGMLTQFPSLAGLTRQELFQVLILRQFITLSLLVPLMCVTAIAAHSIVGEKVGRTLEPLLATPITTVELLAAKSLASVIPAIGITWGFFIVYALGVRTLTPYNVFRNVFTPAALCMTFAVAPLIALLGLSLAIIASSRSTDPRTAQQIGVIVVLPVVGLIVSQITGLFFLTPAVVLAGALILAVIDVAVLAIGVGLFARETILTRWK